MTSLFRISGSTKMDLDLHHGLPAILGCRVIFASDLAADDHRRRRLRLWIFSLFMAPAALLRRLHSSLSAGARSRRLTMIEVPSELLNALFALLIVFASVNRSRQRSASEAGVRTLIQETPSPTFGPRPALARRNRFGTAIEPPNPAPFPSPGSLSALSPRQTPSRSGNSFLLATLTRRGFGHRGGQQCETP